MYDSVLEILYRNFFPCARYRHTAPSARSDSKLEPVKVHFNFGGLRTSHGDKTGVSVEYFDTNIYIMI